jgi:hypothetical protein
MNHNTLGRHTGPDAWEGHQVLAALGGSGQAIYVVPSMEVVITHKVEHGAWTHGWAQVNHRSQCLWSSGYIGTE